MSTRVQSRVTSVTRARQARWPRVKLCTVCGVITSRPGSRCGKHAPLSGVGANHHVHADPRWARLSRRMIARHVGKYGYVCPGDGVEHPAHPTRDLTLDHVLALIAGGAPFDPANTRVLCRSRNSANGARLVNARRADRGDPHAGSAYVEDRDPTTATLVPGMTVTFTPASAVTVVVKCYLEFTSTGGGSRFAIYLDGTKVWPAFGSESGWMAPSGDGTAYLWLAPVCVVSLTAAAHTIAGRESASGSTAGKTYYGRTIEVWNLTVA
jgi:hypothetical protein